MEELKLFVISGGPGTGKTGVINELSKKFKVLPEAAREIRDNDSRFKGKSIKEINPYNFQKAIFNFQREVFSTLKNNKHGIVFLDRGMGDTLAYYKFHNLKILKEEFDYARKFRYSKVFILDFLNFYEKDTLRQESKEEQQKIHEIIIKTYEELEYKPIIVPFMSTSERVRFILSKINNSEKK